MIKSILLVTNNYSIFVKRLLEGISNIGQKELSVDVLDTDSPSESRLFKMLTKLPKLRVIFRAWRSYLMVSRQLKKKKYDAINIHSLPFFSHWYVKAAHKCGAKAILTPIGSDVLRVNDKQSRWLQKAFDETDFVTITENSGFAQKVLAKFRVDQQKVRDLSYGSDAITEIGNMRGHYSKEELAKILGIPYAEYYICCGYNAHRAQNHIDILKAIAANASSLPKGYKVLFPLGYGGGEAVRKDLEQENTHYGLDIVFLMDFLSPKGVAALRLISDLFIHIQNTDAHCFTMREFLLADTQVINGQWLSYPELEQYGLPYYECESKEKLKDTLASFFKGELPPKKCPDELRKSLQASSWDNVAKRWTDFYMLQN